MSAAKMNTSSHGRALIAEFEGCRLVAYRCSAGIPTIGYGHTRGVKMGDRCTQQQADAWLREDLVDAERAVGMLVKPQLTQEQFDALVSFTFNLGTRALAESTMLILLNTHRLALAAEQFGRWVNAGGKRVDGLVRRRAAEKALFLDGLRLPA